MRSPLELDPRIIELLQVSGHSFKPCAQGSLIYAPPDAEYSNQHLLVTLSVASVFCKLPEETLLYSVPKDAEDLTKYWRNLRDMYEWIALAFVDKDLNLKTEPLKKERRGKRITNKWDRLSCEQWASWYHSLWRVVQAGFSVIAEELPGLAETPIELFYEIIREHTESTFSQRKRPYFQNRVVDRIRYYQKQRKLAFNSLSPEAQQKLKNKFLRDPLSARSKTCEAILPVLAEACESDASIKELLDYHDREYNSLAEFLFVDALPARRSQGLIHKSEIWKNGKISSA